MTSLLQRERLDFLLDRLAKDEPLPLGLDQKNDEPLPPVSTKKNDWLSSERWLWIKRWLSSNWLSSKHWLSSSWLSSSWLSSERWPSIKRWLSSSWLSSKHWLSSGWLSSSWLSSDRWLSIKRLSLGKRSSRALIPYLITSSYLIPFCIGVAATLAWKSYGTPSTDKQLKAMSVDLAAIRQSVGQLTAKVQQMAGDIDAQWAILRRVSAPPPPAPPAPRHVN